MSYHFMENIKTFYENNPDVSVHLHGKKVAQPEAELERALGSICKNANFLIENPHLTRVCCDPGDIQTYAEKANTDEARKILHKTIDFCWNVNSGVKPFDDTSVLTHKAHEDHAIVKAIVGEACKDVDFNTKNATTCCTSPGLALGFPTDNERVAHACGLARQ